MQIRISLNKIHDYTNHFVFAPNAVFFYRRSNKNSMVNIELNIESDFENVRDDEDDEPQNAIIKGGCLEGGYASESSVNS